MNENINKMLRDAMQVEVVKALNSAPDVIEKLVQAAFERPVDQYGRKPDSGYARDSMPWLEWMVGDEIRTAARDIVREQVAGSRGVIAAKVSEAVASAGFTAPLVEALTKQLADGLNWQVNLDVKKWGE